MSAARARHRRDPDLERPGAARAGAAVARAPALPRLRDARGRQRLVRRHGRARARALAVGARSSRCPSNVGFAAGVNRGIERARGEYVALVNNDMELHPDFLGALVAALDARPRGRRRRRRRCSASTTAASIDGAGDVLRWSGVVHAARPRRARHGPVRRARPRCSAPAAAPRSTGAPRSTRSGCSTRPSSPRWRTSTGASARACWATAAATSRARSPTTRARRRCAARAAPTRGSGGCRCATASGCGPRTTRASALLRHAHLLLAHELAGLYFAIREGMARAQLRAWRDALRGLPRVLRQRREIQAAAAHRARASSTGSIEPEVVGWQRLGALVRHGRPAPGALALGSLRVVPGDEAPAALAPRAGDGARRAAEVGDDLAGAATGAAGLRVEGLVAHPSDGSDAVRRGRAGRPSVTRARPRRTARPGPRRCRSAARDAASARLPCPSADCRW